ncbi:hypothetical protein COI97_33045, partial [Bacillus cereus]
VFAPEPSDPDMKGDDKKLPENYFSKYMEHYNNLSYNKNINIFLATFLAGGWKYARYVIHNACFNHALSVNSPLRERGGACPSLYQI